VLFQTQMVRNLWDSLTDSLNMNVLSYIN